MLRFATILRIASYFATISIALGQESSFAQSNGITIEVVSVGEFGSRAKRVWENLPNRGDADQLDQFVRLYEPTDIGQLAFSYRFELLQLTHSPKTIERLFPPDGKPPSEKKLATLERAIRAYDLFIDRYPDRMAAFVAVQDAFDLHDMIGTPKAYARFLVKYPATHQAVLAKYRAQVRIFEIAKQENTVEFFDAFLENQPDAPEYLVESAKNLALEAMERRENATKKEAQEKANGNKQTLITLLRRHFDSLHEKYARNHAKLREIKQAFEKEGILLQDRPQHPRFGEYMQLSAEAVRIHNIVQLSKTYDFTDEEITSALSESRFRFNFQEWHLELMDELVRTRKQIQKLNTDFAHVIKTEFAQTRQVMEDGLQQISVDIREATQTIRDGFGRVAGKLEALNSTIEKTNAQLWAIRGELTDINANLQVLHTDLQSVKNEIVAMNTNLGQKMDNLASEVKGLRQDVIEGFQRQEELQQEMIDSLGNIDEGGFLDLGRNARQLLAPATDWVKKQGGAIADSSKQVGERILKAGGGIFGRLPLPEKIIAYDFKSEAKLSFNLMTGTYEGTVELIPGVTFRQTALTGSDFVDKFPFDGNPLKAIGASAIAKCEKHVDAYFSQRSRTIQKHPDELIYFSSERFCDMGGPEGVVDDAAKVILSFGRLSKAVERKYQNLIMLEMKDILAWLKLVGVENGEDFVFETLERLFNGTEPTLPSIGLEVLAIPYTYTFTTPNNLKFPRSEIEKLVVIDSELFEERSVTVKHCAFAIRIGGLKTRESLLAKALDDFERNRNQGTNFLDEDIFNRLKQRARGKARDILDSIDYVRHAAECCENNAHEEIQRQVGLTSNDVKRLFTGSPVIDMKNSPVAERVESMLRGLAQGNESSVKLDRLEFDVASYRVSATALLQHRQSWGYIGDIPGEFRDYLIARGLLPHLE